MASTQVSSKKQWKVNKIMEEYIDIFSSPMGAPQHYYVKHLIDLIPYEPLLNGPIYHRFVPENEKIKRPIQELLQKRAQSI